MLYETCYPALFLFGWDHYYLDTLRRFKQTLHTDSADKTTANTSSTDKLVTVDNDASDKPSADNDIADKFAAVDIR